MWQLRGKSRDGTLSIFLPTILHMWAFVIMHMPHSGIMAAVPPDLTSVFQARRMVDDMEEKTKGSFLARICLLEVRG